MYRQTVYLLVKSMVQPWTYLWHTSPWAVWYTRDVIHAYKSL